MNYAVVFVALAAACVFAATQVELWAFRLFAIWCALAFGGVGLAYAGIGPRAFGKRSDGTLPAWSRAVYAPYFLLNALSLWGFRSGARENAWDEIAPGLFLGCRLNSRDNAAIESLAVVSVLDLTSEFGETARLQALDYLCIPLLDTSAPNLQQLRDGVLWIENALKRGPLYIHCALGHGRSATFVAAYLVTSGRARDADEAIAQIKKRRPHIGLEAGQMTVLQNYASTRQTAL